MVKEMSIRKPWMALAAAMLLFCGAAQAAPSTSRSSTEGPLLKALLHSRALWATVNVCSPADQPDTVAVRGSMPGDGHARDQMFMRVRLQYQNATSKKWSDLPTKFKLKPMLVGGGASVRQGGGIFLLQPQAGKPAFTLRGLVDFQWRRGSRVLQSASRPTTAGHRSVIGADPAGFTRATCLIG
jgi:hypothetical protein